MEEIAALFPTCYAVAHMAPFLVVRVKDLPPKPWPVTIAGLPLYLTQSLDDNPMDWGERASGPKLQIAADLGLWRSPSFDNMVSIFEAFAELGATVDRIQWFGIDFKILAASQPFPDWSKRLPRAINNLIVGYGFGELFRPEKALRKKQPLGNIQDDSLYDDLRPGLKLSSHNVPGVTYETTSGVCVESPDGTKYVTVAKNGFPGPLGAEVWHPHGNGILLGHVVTQFGDSDIALCKLEAGLEYSQEPFCENAEDATITFRELGDLASVSVGDYVYMDNPFTGRVDGNLIAKELLRLPVDPTNEEIDYAVSCFGYFGNGNEEVEEGCCGGVLWNDRQNVLGRFRFAGNNGYSYFPAFETIRRAGYKLSH